MLNCSSCAVAAIPKEYRVAAENLFPSGGCSAGKGPSIEAVKAFAETLGIGADYNHCLSCSGEKGGAGGFFTSFQNNLDLLIQKTWVEKADEIRKENLLDRVPAFIGKIENGDYLYALEDFGGILEELAYLFFGAQSTRDDFTEYTFRIDAQMGLFWWYGSQLCSAAAREWIKSADKEILKAVLWLGICYLTSF
jgi:hypothetical protein